MQNSITDSLPNIGRTSLPTSIMEILTDYLLSGELKPGDKLPTEAELSQKMGVGRNSVREAIKMLSSIGVVEAVRGSGIYIAESMSATMLNPLVLSLVFEQGTSRELIELRLLLETGAAEIAIKNIQNNEIKKLEKINLELEKESKKSKHNGHKLRDLDLSFHKELYRITGNRLLAKIAEAIYKLFYASIEKTVEADPERAYRNHKAIIDALKARNMELVRINTKDSLSYWMRYLSKKER